MNLFTLASPEAADSVETRSEPRYSIQHTKSTTIYRQANKGLDQDGGPNMTQGKGLQAHEVIHILYWLQQKFLIQEVDYTDSGKAPTHMTFHNTQHKLKAQTGCSIWSRTVPDPHRKTTEDRSLNPTMT